MLLKDSRGSGGYLTPEVSHPYISSQLLAFPRGFCSGCSIGFPTHTQSTSNRAIHRIHTPLLRNIDRALETCSSVTELDFLRSKSSGVGSSIFYWFRLRFRAYAKPKYILYNNPEYVYREKKKRQASDVFYCSSSYSSTLGPSLPCSLLHTAI